MLIAAAAAAKSFQLGPTLCVPIDSSTPSSTVPGILQARTLEWVAISFSNAWKRKVKVKSLSCVQLERPHGLQPTRLLRPWDFLGKSTGVACHCLLRVLLTHAHKFCWSFWRTKFRYCSFSLFFIVSLIFFLFCYLWVQFSPLFLAIWCKRLIWKLSELLLYAFTAISFPPSTALAVSHSFWYVVFLFPFFSC